LPANCGELQLPFDLNFFLLSVLEELFKLAVEFGGTDWLRQISVESRIQDLLPVAAHRICSNCKYGQRFKSWVLANSLYGETAEAAIEEGDFRIDFDAHSVFVRSREVRLTPKEFDLLAYLARHPRKIVTHRSLLAAVWGANSIEHPEYLRVFVGHLRKKSRPVRGRLPIC
jgi:DNA-binding response OmpR family regulator